MFEELRYEKKFILSEIDNNYIEWLIKSHPIIFSEIFFERRVNNMYLDSIELKNYNDNVSGISKRMKIRIRWYGKIFGIVKNPVLEIKEKNNELGKKFSFPLKSFKIDESFSYKELQKVFLCSELPKELIEELKIYQPKLLNSYKRKYFLSDDKKYRITLDKDLIFFKIEDRNNSFKEKIIDKERYIFEIKYLYMNEKNIEKIMQYFPFRLSNSSKYVFGIDLLNL